MTFRRAVISALCAVAGFAVAAAAQDQAAPQTTSAQGASGAGEPPGRAVVMAGFR